MSEKRFERWNDHSCKVKDNQEDTFLNWEDVVKKLNEQQDTIQRMKHSLNTIYTSFEKHYGYDMRNAVWLIDELSYDEFEWKEKHGD